MSVRRMLPPPEEGQGQSQVTVSELERLLLDNLANEREWLLMRLRQIEPVLVQHGRLRAETPRRVR